MASKHHQMVHLICCSICLEYALVIFVIDNVKRVVPVSMLRQTKDGWEPMTPPPPPPTKYTTQWSWLKKVASQLV